MLGALTYHTITAMARDRLVAIEAMMLAKIRSRQNVTALERQIRFLAKTAHESMGLAPHLPTETSLPPFARGLSLQTVSGSVGPSFLRYAAMFAPSQRWIYDTIHSGNPDPNRQRVLARSTDLLLKLSERLTELINASTVADKVGELRKANAYLLGYACHIGADVVSAPFVHAASWALDDGTHARLTEDQVADAIEQFVAQMLRRDLAVGVQASRGDLYKDWWLKAQDLPVKLLDAWRDSLESVYGAGARPVLRPAVAAPSTSPQVSAAWLKQFQADAPPELSLKLLEDGYSSFQSVMESNYVWNYADWLAATAWIFFPPIAAYPLIVAMPHTRALFKDGALVDGHPVDKDRGWFGLMMAPLATSLLAPFILSIYIAAGSYFGVGSETILGIVAGSLNLVTSVIFFATTTLEVPAVVRWLLLFSIPFALLLVHAIYVLARGGSDPRHKQLAMGSLIPCIITVVYMLFHLSWHQSQDLGMNGWLKETDGHREGWGNAGFIGGWALWAVLLVGGWLFFSWVLMTRKDPAPAAMQFVTGGKHFPRLFGHSALLPDPNLAQNANLEARNPTLATHYFPTDRRPLLKIWWTGAGDLWMRSDRNALQFSTTQDGTGNPQAVLAPAAPMTGAQFAAFINLAVKEGANFSKKLNAELFDPADFDYTLAPGDVFSDNGDDQTTLALHATNAAKFIKLKTTKDDAIVLYHAPRANLAGFQAVDGPTFVDFDRAVALNGTGQATFAAAAVTGDANTRFTTLFAPGDIISTLGVAAGDETRIVDVIRDDRNMTVTSPFTAAVGVASLNYQRGINSRDVDTPAGNLQITAAFRVYQGVNLDTLFLPGDIVRVIPALPAVPEERIVVQVLSGTQMMVDKPFGPALPYAQSPPAPLPVPAPCVRVSRLTRDGFPYAPVSPSGIFAGDSLMEKAADMAALLAMGMASHRLSVADRQAVTAGPDEDRRPAIQPVYQVFRNWNLNQRRMNEWAMLVSGGAVSEKRGSPLQPDAMQPGVPAGWTALTDGDAISNQLGWLPLLQKWLDVARRPGLSSVADVAFREGDPTNKKLSEGVAYLFDLPMPV
ncbi:MAG: hypothetical protein ABI806_10420 [Candidatus Solibacter sp.]